MAKVLERLQISGNSSALGRDECGVRDAVRALQEQLVKERAKNHRTANKRCQEQRLLVEQVHLARHSHKCQSGAASDVVSPPPPLLASWRS